VQLNGAATRDPETPVDLARDRIAVDGAPVAARARIYLALNKPRGIVTTASDEKGRDTVYDLLPRDLPWLAPVGRLDKASEGLLLLTNDAAWAARVAAPESHLEKTYHVQIAALAGDALLQALERGVEVAENSRLGARRRIRVGADEARLSREARPFRRMPPDGAGGAGDGARVNLENASTRLVGHAGEPPVGRLPLQMREPRGEMLRARRARLLRHGEKNSWLEIVLDEGKNRQIRRMLEAHNVEVLRLIRIAIGPLQLGALPKAASRPLTGEEKLPLDRAMTAAKSSSAPRRGRL
jgi:pseudouridine synthase